MIYNFNNFLNEGLLKGISKEQFEDVSTNEQKIQYFIENKMFDNLPRNEQGVCVYNGCLDLYKCGLTSLPDDLTIDGDFVCSNNNLSNLPENLTVNGYLFCVNQKDGIKLELPKSAKVTGKFIN